MGQLGRTDEGRYPDLRISEAIEIVRKMHQVGIMNQSTLARLIGIDARGAGLHSRVEDLVDYGLIEANGELKVTTLGDLVARGDPRKAWEAFLRIPLYARMHERIQGKDIDNQLLKNILYAITKADDDDITRRLTRLKNNYTEALQYSSSGGSSGVVVAPMDRYPISSSAHPLANLDSDFYLIDKRDTPFFIGLDSKSKIALAIQYLKDAMESMDSKTKIERRPQAKKAEFLEQPLEQ